MIRTQIGRPPIDQLQAVNRFLNDWRYKPDDQNYGQRDYWATPLEFLRRSGDCEDYAIAKYVTLRQLGFAPEQLRLVVVQDVVRDLAHAVLAVYLDEQVYILDNLTKAVLPQERIGQYVPYYSINEDNPLGPRAAGRGAGVGAAAADDAERRGRLRASCTRPARSSHGRSGGRSALRSRSRAAAGRPRAAPFIASSLIALAMVAGLAGVLVKVLVDDRRASLDAAQGARMEALARGRAEISPPGSTASRRPGAG